MYVKMCERAEEIQVLRPSITDQILIQEAILFDPETSVYVRGGDFWYIKLPRKHWKDCNWDKIWLPRQDQLQEMVKDYPVYQLIKFHQWFFSEAQRLWEHSAIERYPNSDPFTTWEQLWLAFVMKEKYNKVWNGEDWVKK